MPTAACTAIDQVPI